MRESRVFPAAGVTCRRRRSGRRSALAGAATELVRSKVRAGQTDSLPDLEETLMSLHLAVLAARPWA